MAHIIPPCLPAAGEPLPRNCRPYTGGYPLFHRISRGLGTGDPVILWMSWSYTAELPEAANVVERHGRLPEPFVIGVDRLHVRQGQDRPEQRWTTASMADSS